MNVNIPDSYDRSAPEPLQPEPAVFLADPVLDSLAHVTFELAAELWSVKNRVRLLEAALSKDGRDIKEEIEQAYQADPTVIANEEERNAYVRRLFSELLSHGEVPRT